MRNPVTHTAPRLWLCASITLLSLTGCATYTPQPLDPAALEDQFRARTLAEPFTARGEQPPAQWDIASLTIVALHYHPDIAIARARLRGSDAALVTAGQRPNPTLAWAPQYAFNPDPGQSPWVLGFDVDIPIEIAGKRDHRIEQATALQDAARLELSDACWKLRQRVRSAVIDHLVLTRQLHQLTEQVVARRRVVELIDRRAAAGEISSFEARATRMELGKAEVELETLRAAADGALQSLAEALAVPADSLRNIRFDDRLLTRLADPQVAAPPAIRLTGVVNRLDIRRALAEYQAAEAALHLEVVRQYPDIHLGPGYQYDQGQNKLNFGLTAEIPIFHQNQGPIAEAAAKREEAAAHVTAVQSAALNAMDKSLAAYAAAQAELAAAQRFHADQSRRAATAAHMLEVGENDSVAELQERIALGEANRLRLESLRHVHAALTALEDAVQRPLDGTPETIVPTLPPVSAAPLRPASAGPIEESRD